MDWKDRLNLMLTEKSSRKSRRNQHMSSTVYDDDDSYQKPNTLGSGRKSGTRIPVGQRTPAATAARVARRKAAGAARKTKHPQALANVAAANANASDNANDNDKKKTTVESRTDWKDRLKALVLETYKPGSTRTRVIDHQTGEEIEDVGSTRRTPPQPNRTVDKLLKKINQKNQS
jgi:hypothetical protein